MTIAHPNVATLVDQLDLEENLPDVCRSAFLAVRREEFVPRQAWARDDEAGEYVPIDRDADPARWFAAVYSDRPIVTQYDEGETRWPKVGQTPTCSASQPSAVAGMLAELDPQPGEHVCEIGTGTGWNAALIAHMVGASGGVTSVEVDSEVANAARVNLSAAEAGNVRVVNADAITFLPPAGVDRIIATAAVQSGELPYGWVQSTRPGGVIVAPMRTHLSSGPVVRFIVADDGSAAGRASERLQVGFMQLRAQRVRGAIPGLLWDDPTADVTYTEVEPWPVLGELNSRWAVAMALPRCVYDLWEKTDERRGVAWLRDQLSGSWASVSPHEDRFIVRQSGPRRLWDVAEAAYGWWVSQGEPPLGNWLWKVEPDRQTVLLQPR